MTCLIADAWRGKRDSMLRASRGRLGRVLLAASLLIAATCGFAQDRVAEAVNRSAHAQMLVERSARSYAMLGQGVIPDRSRRQLDTDIAAFDADLAVLRTIAMNPQQKLGLARLAEAWSGVRAVLKRPATLDGARALIPASEALGVLAQKCHALLRPPVVDRFDAVGLAGDARTLSQRVAKLYFYFTWGLKTEGVVNQLIEVEQEYRSAMDKLSVAPQNDDSTQADLALAASQWVFFADALSKLGTGDGRMRFMADVGKSSDAMLDVLDGLALKYQFSKEQD